MSDLETRVRDSLNSDLARPDIDHFLAGVRRRSAWRRGRHAAAGVVVLVAAIIGTSVVVQHSQDHGTSPRPITTPTTSPTSAASSIAPESQGRVVDLAASGDQVFRLTWNLGCSACSSVWRRELSGDWTRLHDFTGAAAYGGHVTPRYGPVDTLVMAPNGQDGLADGRLLWATHDGGRTWTQVVGGPGPRSIFGRYVAVGTHTGWAVRRASGGVTLWRSDLGSDTWQRVTGVPRLRDFTTFAGVADDDRVALVVSGEGGSDNALVLGRPGSWSQVPMAFGADVLVRTDGTTFWASVPGPHGLRLFRLEDGGWRDLGQERPQNWFPLDDQRVLLDQPTVVVLTVNGTETTDLRGAGRILRVSRTAGGTFWLLTWRGRVYSSTDALHWTPST